ncbi:MAG: HAMP domain-containing histidine kinase, partial [Muribaculaceae bacterium]|nr:HAMP domain-containing histidine kinase [Muribaculaceae bacterium]
PGVSLRFPKKDAEPVLIETDPYRLQVVLLNLLNNAAKFTESGTITLDYEIMPDQVKFTVTDTGCGVPEGKEETIFNRFTTDDSSSGHGLGLPVCRLIATLLHGSVELDTAYTGGARFIFTIPR